VLGHPLRRIAALVMAVDRLLEGGNVAMTYPGRSPQLKNYRRDNLESIDQLLRNRLNAGRIDNTGAMTQWLLCANHSTVNNVDSSVSS
jgi:hypothetical protein